MIFQVDTYTWGWEYNNICYFAFQPSAGDLHLVQMVAPAELPTVVIAELAGQDPDVQQVYINTMS